MQDKNEIKLFHELTLKEMKKKEQEQQIVITEHPLETKITGINNCFTYSPYQIYQLYYYYYSKWIWQLINIYGCKYEWINIWDEQFDLESMTQKSASDFSEQTTKNDYLQLYEKRHIQLGQDLLKNGCFFPFGIGYNNNNHKLSVLFGKHRIYSLLLSPRQNKKFLFIQYPYLFNNNTKNIDFLNSPLKKPFECYFLSLQYTYSIYSYKTTNPQDIFDEFLWLSDYLPHELFNFREIIKPNIIFNDETAFHSFITQPFNDNNLKEIQKLWPY